MHPTAIEAMRLYCVDAGTLPARKKQMNKTICQKIISICNDKIEKKGENVGLSFYAFFANKNNNPELLRK